MRLVRVLALSIPVLCFAVAHASDFTTNEFVTYSGGVWGDNGGAGLLESDYDNVYLPSSDLLVLGDFYTLTFTNADAVQTYEHDADGAPGALTISLLDPTHSSAGSLGGSVLGLRLDVDYSAAGLLAHPDGIPFGDLILTDLEDDTDISASLGAFDGETVDDFLAYDEFVLGGAATPYTLGDLQYLSAQLSAAFNGGNVDSFADDSLELPSTGTGTGSSPSPTPEPPTWMLLLAASAALPLLNRRTC